MTMLHGAESVRRQINWLKGNVMTTWYRLLRDRWPVVVVAFSLIAITLVWRTLLWPGSITHDGLWVLQGAETGPATTYHPYLNTLLARLLAVPFKSIALYIVLQSAYCIAVVLWIVNRIHSRERSAALVLAIGAFFVLSIPVGLYVGMFWKDVPFAFGVLFITYAIYDTYRDKSDTYGFGFWILLAISTAFVSFMRHGHLFNLLIVPALLYATSRSRRVALVSFSAGCVVWLLMVASALTWLPVRNDAHHMARIGILAGAQPFLATLSAPGGYVSDDPGGDQSLLRSLFVPNALELYNPKYGDAALIRPGEELPPGARERLLRRITKLCLLNVSKCLGDRVQLFAATLFPADRVYGMTFYDLGQVDGPCSSIYGMRPDHCAVLERYVSEEKPLRFAAESQSLLARVEQRSNWERRLFYWNNALGIVTLVAVLLIWSPRSRLWWAAVFIVVQCAVPFAFSTASDFRYYFPLYLFGLLFAPLVAVEAIRACKAIVRGLSSSATRTNV